MCTVSWRYGEEDVFSVFFNRDELRTRAASELVAPSQTEAGTSFVAPRDPVAGGTWLAANAHGVVVGVLNNYGGMTRVAPGKRSRGELPLAFADCCDLAAIRQQLPQLRPEDYAPFLLLAWDPSGVAGWKWDGGSLALLESLAPPIATSSFATEEVCAWRRERFGKVAAAGTRAALMAFHDDTAHPQPAFNVRMRRSDARTESVCRVDVLRDRIVFHHRRESPDALAARDSSVVALARA